MNDQGVVTDRQGRIVRNVGQGPEPDDTRDDRVATRPGTEERTMAAADKVFVTRTLDNGKVQAGFVSEKVAKIMVGHGFEVTEAPKAQAKAAPKAAPKADAEG